MLKLNDGNEIPLVGLGTFQLRNNLAPDTVLKTLDVALQTGYRLIDTASCYRNEKDIGEALTSCLYEKHSLSRKDLFITSKLAPKEMGYNSTIATCKKTLNELQTDYLDLYLIHWPGKNKLKSDDEMHKEYRKETWRAFQDLKEQGFVKSIGVSNFTMDHLTELMEFSNTKPVVNQVEFHPVLYQKELLNFCQQNNIFLQAYSSLGTGQLLNNEIVSEVADMKNCTNAQILLKWATQQSVGVLPKSTKAEHIRSNFYLSSIHLDPQDMEKLSALHCGTHYCWDPNKIK
ncbi:glyoxal reductase-like isoform X2 [Clytia hemisphaerica]|uniref:NADP-dependent oxidoreductase domain-containing protein n=1 Tax=Clytia hemisphaerica TaxID=252671 RepID=A0A7M5UKW8_9CNID